LNKIIIKDLEVFYHVGVPDEERAHPQRLLITVEMEHDFSEAAKIDDLTKTIDYFAVAQRLLKFGEGRSWKLLEKLANDITTLVINEFHASGVTVEIKKFIIPEARYVAVRTENKGKKADF
jgi:FolB domain-containing protein